VIDFFGQFLTELSTPVDLIEGSPGSGKRLTLFTWAWGKSSNFKNDFGVSYLPWLSN
jgi:hypothetical protein